MEGLGQLGRVVIRLWIGYGFFNRLSLSLFMSLAMSVCVCMSVEVALQLTLLDNKQALIK